MSALDLDAYFARIGYAARARRRWPRCTARRRARRPIPFENLDVLLGRPIELATEAVIDKLVRRRRGGYCFEQNTLLLEVLTRSAFTSARCRRASAWQRPRDYTPARTHLFVRVELDGEPGSPTSASARCR